MGSLQNYLRLTPLVTEDRTPTLMIPLKGDFHLSEILLKHLEHVTSTYTVHPVKTN